MLAPATAGIKMLLSQGNPLSEYTDWYSCYGSVYTAAPIEIGEATCAVKNFIEELNQKFDDAIADLLEILQWLVFPSRTAKRKVVEKLKAELRKAALGWGTAPSTRSLRKPNRSRYATHSLI
jgi:TorA maturation chaperone TorD